ncbi:MAG: hypothetical protein HY774_06070 [Acidobacteria bacterium]|jgi:hypothetical protein|nr:hypothetical protein [Acidobacteriota bacterium]
MAITEQQAVEIAVADFAKRRGVNRSDIKVIRTEKTQFANAVLGAPVSGEMAAMMMTDGWRIIVQTKGDGDDAEYRANPQQVRLFRYQGSHYKIYP